MRALRHVVLAAALGFAAGGCFRHRSPSTEAPSARSTVHVDNHNWLDVVVYVEHDGQRSRLGQVTAASSQTFLLPPHMIGQTGAVRLFAHAIGSPGAIVTDMIIVRPGSQVDWTLEDDLRRSSIAVY